MAEVLVEVAQALTRLFVEQLGLVVVAGAVVLGRLQSAAEVAEVVVEVVQL